MKKEQANIAPRYSRRFLATCEKKIQLLQQLTTISKREALRFADHLKGLPRFWEEF